MQVKERANAKLAERAAVTEQKYMDKAQKIAMYNQKRTEKLRLEIEERRLKFINRKQKQAEELQHRKEEQHSSTTDRQAEVQAECVPSMGKVSGRRKNRLPLEAIGTRSRR
jgi:hypothetical protein